MCARFAAGRQTAHLGALLARGGDRRYLRCFSACSLRLAAQDVALSRRKQGFESPRERQFISSTFCFEEVRTLFVQWGFNVCNIAVLALTSQLRHSRVGKLFSIRV